MSMCLSLLRGAVPSMLPWTSGLAGLAALSSRAASSCSPYRDECVTTSADGAVIVCWHPEPKFPLEHTRPVPRQANSTDGHMQVQYVNDMEELYHHKPERLRRRDLMRLTWTTKHRWFPNNEGRYNASRKWEKERPYL